MSKTKEAPSPSVIRVAAAVPTALTMAEAASIPLVGLTAWQVLIDRAKLKPGQKVLIHAGSGGVGTFAVQLAKAFGARILDVDQLGALGFQGG